MQMATLKLGACRATLARGSNSVPWEEQPGKSLAPPLPETSVRRIKSASFVPLGCRGRDLRVGQF